MFDDSRRQERMDRGYRYQRARLRSVAQARPVRPRAGERGAAPWRRTSVLEIGCGTGRNLKLMAEAYPALRLTRIDISDEMLKFARAKLARTQFDERISLQRGDAAQRILMS